MSDDKIGAAAAAAGARAGHGAAMAIYTEFAALAKKKGGNPQYWFNDGVKPKGLKDTEIGDNIALLGAYGLNATRVPEAVYTTAGTQNLRSSDTNFADASVACRIAYDVFLSTTRLAADHVRADLQREADAAIARYANSKGNSLEKIGGRVDSLADRLLPKSARKGRKTPPAPPAAIDPSDPIARAAKTLNRQLNADEAQRIHAYVTEGGPIGDLDDEARIKQIAVGTGGMTPFPDTTTVRVPEDPDSADTPGPVGPGRGTLDLPGTGGTLLGSTSPAPADTAAADAPGQAQAGDLPGNLPEGRPLPLGTPVEAGVGSPAAPDSAAADAPGQAQAGQAQADDAGNDARE